jgi:hypothetical protein
VSNTDLLLALDGKRKRVFGCVLQCRWLLRRCVVYIHLLSRVYVTCAICICAICMPAFLDICPRHNRNDFGRIEIGGLCPCAIFYYKHFRPIRTRLRILCARDRKRPSSIVMRTNNRRAQKRRRRRAKEGIYFSCYMAHIAQQHACSMYMHEEGRKEDYVPYTYTHAHMSPRCRNFF